jgi:glycosidase
MRLAILARLLTATLAVLFSISARAQGGFTPVAWAKGAKIYEVNIRQYTAEGTFRAFESHLPRLRKLGVNTLWIMPISPIGVTERKGSLGSYYSIRDYRGINPEFGTIADFKHLVRQAHGMGFKVMLDWVANHTARDHPWIAEHPDWYVKNKDGQIGGYTFMGGDGIEEWSDVSQLDYQQPAVREAMIAAMMFWVKEAAIDGFRCDVAGLVPIDFWKAARSRIDAVKPLLWLAEWNDPLMHEAFDVSYHWEVSNIFQAVAKGKASAATLRDFYRKVDPRFPAGALRMNFTSNHDYNSWHGTDAELYGRGFEAFAVLAASLPGIPLVYSGQEAGLNKRLAFFEKDQISWNSAKLANRSSFYRSLLASRPSNAAIEIIDAGPSAIFAFRQGSVQVSVNLSDNAHSAFFPGRKGPVEIAPWGWCIAPRKNQLSCGRPERR